MSIVAKQSPISATAELLLIMAALHSRCGHYIFALWFLLSLFLFFPRLISAVAEWMSIILLAYTWCGLSANLESRSEMCCTQFAGNTGSKNDAKNRYRALNLRK